MRDVQSHHDGLHGLRLVHVRLVHGGELWGNDRTERRHVHGPVPGRHVRFGRGHDVHGLPGGLLLRGGVYVWGAQRGCVCGGLVLHGRRDELCVHHVQPHKQCRLVHGLRLVHVWCVCCGVLWLDDRAHCQHLYCCLPSGLVVHRRRVCGHLPHLHRCVGLHLRPVRRGLLHGHQGGAGRLRLVGAVDRNDGQHGVDRVRDLPLAHVRRGGQWGFVLLLHLAHRLGPGSNGSLRPDWPALAPAHWPALAPAHWAAHWPTHQAAHRPAHRPAHGTTYETAHWQTHWAAHRPAHQAAHGPALQAAHWQTHAPAHW